MDILIGIIVLALALAGLYLILRSLSNRSCQGCVVGGCAGPVLGFLLLFIAIGLSGDGDAPDFGGLFFLPFFVLIGAVIGAIIGAILSAGKN